MDRNLALEMVRVTEAAALSCAQWYGKGDKYKADEAAVEAMKKRFDNVDFDGTVVIGEGEIDQAPMLYNGEKVGSGKGDKIDLAIDPLECTDSVAKGLLNALSVIALSPQGGLLSLPDMYMDKIAVGPKAAGKINIHNSVEENIKIVAKALNKNVEEVTVVILDRTRHDNIVAEIRKTGARIRFITDGDVSGAIAPSYEDSGIDLLLGIGKSTEAVLAASAIRCLGGEIQAILMPKDDQEKQRLKEMGINDLSFVYHTNDLAKSEHCMFVATGVSDGPLLRGVQFTAKGAMTHSVVMRAKTGTIRFIEAHHFHQR
ncbi:class II fructose-bisphosphatase [Candidatus Woesearchaeota archaeon]|nr:class II fructose-bisphosphatase [Candidatus Woesearchaeota archaeon]